MQKTSIHTTKFRISKFVSKIDPSLLLFLAAIFAIILANSTWHESYFNFLKSEVDFSIAKHNFFAHHGRNMTLQEFVNDALMVIFFFVIGLEIKMELMVGQLSEVRKAILPVVAALGGMLMPVLFFLVFVHEPPAVRGAAIPMATDIAFALAVLALVGKRVPQSLKVFLMSLAVVDDIGGIIIIAVFYTDTIHFAPLITALVLLLLTYALGKRGLDKAFVYYFIGFIVWTLFLESGIHSTIAGVLLAFTVPAHCTIKLKDIVSDMRKFAVNMSTDYALSNEKAEKLSEKQLFYLRHMEKRIERTISPLQFIEHDLSPLVSYVILPLFAFVNAGVNFGNIEADKLMGLPMAVFSGLFFGKMLGIFLFTYLPTRFNLLNYPRGMTNSNLLGISIFGGIGFTVSLFIASLSYDVSTSVGASLLDQAKVGVFTATILSALLGVTVLKAVLKKEAAQERLEAK